MRRRQDSMSLLALVTASSLESGSPRLESPTSDSTYFLTDHARPISRIVRKRQLQFTGHCLRMDTDEPANIVALYVFNRGLTTTRSTKADIFGPDTRSPMPRPEGEAHLCREPQVRQGQTWLEQDCCRTKITRVIELRKRYIYQIGSAQR